MSDSKKSFDPQQLPGREVYQLLIGSVVPRPIAWVSSQSAEGVLNLAPFSYFMGITGAPPMMAVSVNRGRRNASKDTLRNVEATGELVINVATEATASQMNQSSAEFEAEVDEFEITGLTPVPSQIVKPPRVAEAPINIECRVNQIVYVGREGNSGLIIVEALLWHIDPSVLTADNTIDVTQLHAIGRLRGSYYTRTRDLFEMERPT